VLHQPLWYLLRAHLGSRLLERLHMGLGLCQHTVMYPVEGAGTFLGDASTCPGCACLLPSLQYSRAWLPGRSASPEAAALFLCCRRNGAWRGKPSTLPPALVSSPSQCLLQGAIPTSRSTWAI